MDSSSARPFARTVIFLPRSIPRVCRPSSRLFARQRSNKASFESRQSFCYALLMRTVETESLPDAQGHFGPYGGRFVPETLIHPLQELEAEYLRAEKDPEFQRDFKYYLR